MNRLTQIEADRVISVLEDSIKKLSILSLLQLDVFPTPESLTEVVGEEVGPVLLEHKALEDRYDDLSAQAKELKALNHRSRFRDVQNEMKELSTQIRESSRNVAQLLLDYPFAVDRLQMVLRDRPRALMQFLQSFIDLRDLSKDKLETTVEEERDKQERLEDIGTKEKKVSSDKASLEHEVQAEKEAHERDLAVLNDAISKLKEELQEIKNRSTSDAHRLVRSTQTETQLVTKSFEERMRDLGEQRKKLEEDLARITKQNREEERELRKTKQNLENDVKQNITNYDANMTQKKAEFDALMKVFVQEKAEVEQYEARFKESARLKELEAFRKRRDEEATARKKADADDYFRKVAILQALFRRRQAARLVEDLRKKMRKGKGAKGARSPSRARR